MRPMIEDDGRSKKHLNFSEKTTFFISFTTRETPKLVSEKVIKRDTQTHTQTHGQTHTHHQI